MNKIRNIKGPPKAYNDDVNADERYDVDIYPLINDEDPGKSSFYRNFLVIFMHMNISTCHDIYK